MRIKKSSVYVPLAGVALLFAVAYAMQQVIVPIFAYMGYTSQAFGLPHIIAYSLFILLLFMASKVKVQSVRFLLTIQLVIPVLSVIVLYANGVASLETALITGAAMALIYVFSPLLALRYRWRLLASERSFVLISISIVAVYILTLIAQRGVSNFVLSFSDVYEYRAEQAEAGSSYAMGMLRSTSMAFLGVLYAYGVFSRKKVVLVFCVGALLLLFLYSGQKRFIFLIPFIYVMCTAVKRNNIYYVLLMYTVPLALGIGYFVATGSFNLISLVGRRAMFVPGLLTEHYIQHFSAEGFMWFSHSKIGQIIGTYDSTVMHPARLIGDLYLGGGNANVNWIGSGFMNMGWFGILVYAIVVTVLFRLPSMLTHETNRRIFLAGCIVPYSTFMQNSDLVTSILSNGVGAYIMIFFFWGNARFSVQPLKERRSRSPRGSKSPDLAGVTRDSAPEQIDSTQGGRRPQTQ